MRVYNFELITGLERTPNFMHPWNRIGIELP